MRKWFSGLGIWHKLMLAGGIFFLADFYAISETASPGVAALALIPAAAFILVFARGISGPLQRQAVQLQSANESLRREIDQRQQAEREIQKAHDSLEQRVKMRTRELQMRIEERLEAEAKLETTYKQLADTSRQAGMAEVATGVLHNVGNVLNSVNVATRVLIDQIRKSESASLAKLNDMVAAHKDDLPAFLSSDERGKHVPAFLAELSASLQNEQKTMLAELDTLTQGVDHIREIIAAQQSIARKGTVLAPTDPAQLLETALAIQGSSLKKHGIEVVRRFESLGTPPLDTHKVLQILINLINNARQAMEATGNSANQLTLVIDSADGDIGRMIRFHVIDTGVGIAPENLDKIFVHGFTTKKDGHGFGLHSAVSAAHDMGGDLTVSSDGPARGAAFVLAIPFNPPDAAGAIRPLEIAAPIHAAA